MLNFDQSWRFDSPGKLPASLVNDFSDLIGRIAGQVRARQWILEHFKHYFAKAAGQTSHWSSNESWAETDLDSHIRSAAENAPLFIEAFYDACADLADRYPNIAVPDVIRMNRSLHDASVAFQIVPPNLVCLKSHEHIAVQEQVRSLDEQAQDLIQNSLRQSEALLAEGRNRQAVQEILWLLETVTTAFRGIEIESGTLQGKYFNKIVDELRRHHKGKILEQVVGWVNALHGYLSSPTGGGVRHGVDLKMAAEMQGNEARLYCNLIRSYIDYLMAEHDKLTNVP